MRMCDITIKTPPHELPVFLRFEVVAIREYLEHTASTYRKKMWMVLGCVLFAFFTAAIAAFLGFITTTASWEGNRFFITIFSVMSILFGVCGLIFFRNALIEQRHIRSWHDDISEVIQRARSFVDRMGLSNADISGVCGYTWNEDEADKFFNAVRQRMVALAVGILDAEHAAKSFRCAMSDSAKDAITLVGMNRQIVLLRENLLWVFDYTRKRSDRFLSAGVRDLFSEAGRIRDHRATSVATPSTTSAAPAPAGDEPAVASVASVATDTSSAPATS